MSEQRIREDRRELGYFQQQMEQLYARLPWSHRLIVGLSMAAQALVAGSMGYGLGLLLHTQQAFWGALTAIAVTQQTYIDTRKLSRDQVIGAAIGAAVALIGASLAQDNYVVYAITMAVAIVLCWSFNIGSAGKLSATTVTIVMLVPHEGAFWTVALTRLGEVTIGIASALVVTRIAHWLEARLIGDPHADT
ncbi:FUSC family protein [Dyella psychrodurans]|uniref:FUSC family protein n=1 Tax=Dyella psychrodurans TaxID=1927960 RepID=A0A370WX18_9GAMM|nr:FUSC family protein [Dyella psychrodurans]RDS80693.1 FUSC family protein [Dyella psychrodurans]